MTAHELRVYANHYATLAQAATAGPWDDDRTIAQILEDEAPTVPDPRQGGLFKEGT